MLFLRLRARLWHPVMLLFVCLLIVAAAVPVQTRPAPNRWIVVLHDSDRVERLLDVEQPDRAATLRAFRDDAFAARIRLIAELTDSGGAGARMLRDWTSFWIVPALVVSCSADEARRIAQMPSVKAVVPNETVHLIDVLRPGGEVGASAEDGDGWTYGLKMIQKPELKKAHPDVDGRGVVVGQIDTGILASHVEFKGVQITFKDFIADKKQPYDDNGHGTHISGTILGRGAGPMQIGVAPGVTKLYVGKAFNRYGSGDSEGLLRALEWMADPDGNPDTNDAPRLVSNSWGGGPGQTYYREAVRRWVSLGIFPCFAAGNAGPRAGTVGTPGGFPESFAVGATDGRDQVAPFSSRGPATFDGKQIVKPDASAPGVQVLSAFIPQGGDGDKNKRYYKASGTSMATPHVAGAVALLLQAKPALKIQQVRELLEATVDPIKTQSAKDNNGGAGRINVLKLVRQGLRH